MMFYRNFKIVLKKELKELFRDKKNLIATFLMPLIIYPLMFLFIGGGFDNTDNKGKASDICVIEVSTSGENILVGGNPSLNYITGEILKGGKVNIKSPENPTDALIKGEISLILKVEADAEKKVKDGELIDINLIFDNRSQTATTSYQVIGQLVNGFQKRVYDARLLEKFENAGMDKTDIDGLNSVNLSGSLIDDLLIGSDKRTGTDNPFIIMILPMLVALLVSIGGSSIAVDLIAGEKERNTFEPLLSTSSNRFSILLAKCFIVFFVAIVSALSQIVSLIIGLLINSSTMGATSIIMPWETIGLIGLNILLLASLFCAVMLVLASSAKSYKEASTKVSFLIFIPMILAYSTIFTDAIDIGIYNMFIPIINVVSIIKMALTGLNYYSWFWLAIAMNFIYLSVSVFITFKVFSKESLISRS